MKKIASLFLIIASVSGCRSLPEKGSSASSTPAPAPSLSPAENAATSRIKLTVVKVDSEETVGENGGGTNAVDGDVETIWHTQWQDASPEPPHEIIIRLSEPATLVGFTYLPRQDDSENGMIKDYEFYVSDDGKDFGQPIKKGVFSYTGKEKQTVKFEARKCQYIKLRALSEINGAAYTSAAEIGVIATD